MGYREIFRRPLPEKKGSSKVKADDGKDSGKPEKHGEGGDSNTTADDIVLHDIDARTVAWIKKAMNKYPTASNELEALVKLMQADLDHDSHTHHRFSKEQEKQNKEIGNIEAELHQDTIDLLQNKHLIRNILDRLERLEKAMRSVHDKQEKDERETNVHSPAASAGSNRRQFDRRRQDRR